MQALELNAHPERLDLPEVDCRKARERGVKIVIRIGRSRPQRFRRSETSFKCSARVGEVGGNGLMSAQSSRLEIGKLNLT